MSGQQTQTATKQRRKKKTRQKEQNEDLKSKTTGLGIKISVDAAPTNNKIVFDDSNLPTNEDDDGDNNEGVDRETTTKEEGSDDDDAEDDDAVEEVQGKSARDEAIDQIETEAKQSLKTKKKRKRKSRIEKIKEYTTKANETDGDESDDDDDDEMDDKFFAQLDSVKQQESEEKKELEREAAREASKGKHTTFVFSKNDGDNEGESDPTRLINENMHVVVLKDPSSSALGANGSFAATTTSISEKALLYSRNRLIDGVDRKADITEMKRKINRSGEVIQPWKRARQRLSMGRSRLTKGKPAAFFGRSKKR